MPPLAVLLLSLGSSKERVLIRAQRELMLSPDVLLLLLSWVSVRVVSSEPRAAGAMATAFTLLKALAAKGEVNWRCLSKSSKGCSYGKNRTTVRLIKNIVAG